MTRTVKKDLGFIATILVISALTISWGMKIRRENYAQDIIERIREETGYEQVKVTDHILFQSFIASEGAPGYASGIVDPLGGIHILSRSL